MSCQILPFAPPETVDAAWERYRAMAVQHQSDPALQIDRGFNERLAGAWQRWRDLYLAEAGR